MTAFRCLAIAAVMSTAALALTAGPALAWGPNGHAIVGDIAQDRLTPKAKAVVDQLLSLEGHHTLDEVASWPDTVGHLPKDKGGLPDTLPWHYVDVPTDQPAYDPARDCADDNCVLARLPEQARILADTKAAPEARLAALKWVVHLVGDLHQPLHAAERNHDKGGNDVKVRYFDEDRNGHLNLHSVWDGSIVDRELGLSVNKDYSIDLAKAKSAAATLEPGITAYDVKAWTPKTPSTKPPFEGAGLDKAVQAWGEESHGLARDVVYGLLQAPESDGVERLAQGYETAAWPLVRMRLEMAGVRLAWVVNQAVGH
ncbi:S1/P1 nuclease [Nitrospirillum amazonense]|uniref:S1/P1 nuclease n=1 Tax=Nitrospirillum amazonense TaxID=28077 RepID=UPI002412B1AA|nr:S1/P1 nuclease [Nitrospirillum amazonense]MDG3440774.1 S1/P1 nuclease [Nitrospirillum amazonense]